MPRWFCPLMLAALAVMTTTPVAGQSSASPPTLSVPYVHHVPVIQDFVRVQESADAHAAGMAMVDRLIQRAPDDGAPISERTRVYIGYDSEHVYAAFVCFDSAPSAVRGQLVGRERIPDDDDNVALQLDTFGDRKHAYTFQVSAAGVQRDGIWTESAAAWDFSFDAIWQAESRRTRYGYVVLIRVPLSSLRFPARAEQSWGLFFFREIPRKGELGFWPAYSPRVAGRLTQAASATGVRGVAAAGSLQFTPYTTAQAVDDTSTAVDVSRPGVGLDTKWVIRNRYVLDATVNPDFSQIESDEPQVTANERFETFFPEKRPFFLENASYFTTPIALLFTRRIVDPQIGDPRDRQAGPVCPRRPRRRRRGARRRPIGAGGCRCRTCEQKRWTGRAGRHIREHARAGSRRQSDCRYGWAICRRVQLDRHVAGGRDNDHGRRQARRRRTGLCREPHTQRTIGHVTAEWHDRGAGFRAAAGYVPRSDFRSLEQALAYRFRPAGRRLIAWGPDLSVTHVWDRRGARLDSALTPRLTFEWTGPVTLALFHTLAQQRLRPTEIAAVSEPHDTDADRTGIELTFSGLERLVWSAAVSGGAAVNLQPVARGNPDPADDLEGSVTASARIARGLTIDATFLGRRVSEPASAASILQNHIWRLKATYQFTPELGIRTIVQRETLTTNAALTTLWPYTDATTDVLVTYMTAPGRALFIGASRYNDRRTPQPSSRGWQLFAKLSYAFQL